MIQLDEASYDEIDQFFPDDTLIMCKKLIWLKPWRQMQEILDLIDNLSLLESDTLYTQHWLSEARLRVSQETQTVVWR